MDEARIVAALAALTTGSGRRTKMGILRALLPVIEAAQAAGVPHHEIWKTLTLHGLDVSEKTYSVMLTRARSQVRRNASTAVPQVAPPTPHSEQRSEPPEKAAPTADFHPAKSDPYGVLPDKQAVSRKFDTYSSSNSLLKRTKKGES
uniref:hypothetical protein n=1 Tax=Cupriavidus gilardii TaxID=82541 RepID=UPI00247A87A4|nr:hypothetical protein [Cupriavidus gilardii]